MGQPSMLKTCYRACAELTQGTETSKYLEDKKSIEIPRVVASEKGRAQTRSFMIWGCRTAYTSKHIKQNISGKLNQRG